MGKRSFRFFLIILIINTVFVEAGFGDLETCGVKMSEVAPPLATGIDPEILVKEQILDPEIAPLDTPKAIERDCVAIQVCVPGQVPPKEYRFLHKFVLRVGKEFKESILAIRGKNLLSRPIAMADFLKNMVIIYTGQLYGAMVMNGNLKHIDLQSIMTGFAHLTPVQLMIAWNTLFMVWTQSERGAAATQEVVLPQVKSFGELGSVMRLAYRGEKGFWPEVQDRLAGFLSLIPVEVVHLSLLSSLVALLPHQADFGSHDHLQMMANMSTFAFLFGTYMSFKWALISKVFDLRGLPVLRNWMSRSWQNRKEVAGLRVVEKNSSGAVNVKDDITFSGLLTKDFVTFLRKRKFSCSMNGNCKFSNEELSEREIASKTQYFRRWNSYLNFIKIQNRNGLNVPGEVTNALGFPLEMGYRYANSLLDGVFVMWLAQKGAPEFLNWIKSLN